VLTGGHSQVGRGADSRGPYGFKPTFTSMIISSFQRAGEKAYLASLSYNFSKLGLQGMKFYAAYGKGVDALGAKTGDPLSNRDELDLRLAFEPNSGPLVGLRAEVEYIDEHYDETDLPNNDLRPVRAIVNYKMLLL
jgi:hypothetical protein